jgi:hypothetical protein
VAVLDQQENNMIIGIGGYARTGKDTFGEALVNVLSRYGIKSKTYALATQLKIDLDALTKSDFGISAFTKDDSEKYIIRPLLVGYGESWRKANPDHWLEILNSNIELSTLSVITDIRYENEADWILKNNGQVIYLNRRLPDGTYVKPANNEEALNSPFVKGKSCFEFCWETTSDQNEIEQIVESIIITLFGDDLNLWKQTFPL